MEGEADASSDPASDQFGLDLVINTTHALSKSAEMAQQIYTNRPSKSSLQGQFPPDFTTAPVGEENMTKTLVSEGLQVIAGSQGYNFDRYNTRGMQSDNKRPGATCSSARVDQTAQYVHIPYFQ